MTDTNMIQRAKTRKANILFFVKILVVLIFPLEMVLSSSLSGWISLLLVVHSNQFPVFRPMLSVLVGLVIMLPCIYFERLLNNTSISKPVMKQVVAYCTLSCGISAVLLITGVASPYSIVFDSISGALPLYTAAIYAPILGISFFVFLPMILRESAKRSISRKHGQLSYKVVSSILQKKFKREKVLSGLLWFGLLFCPFIIAIINTAFSFQMSSISIFYLVYLPTYPVYLDVPFFGNSLQLKAFPVDSLPILLLLSSVRFVFVRDIFRFQKGIINRSRLASEAILGEILPSALITSLTLITSSGPAFQLLFPTPILPIFGFIFIKLSRAVHMKDELWPDYESKMWYEQGQEPHATEPPEESVKVPLTYLLISKVRNLRHKEA